MVSRRKYIAAASGLVAAGTIGYTVSRSQSVEGDINIGDFGAVGDGQTNDLTAISDAIDAAEPGDTVVLPQSDDPYLISFDGTGNEAAIRLGEENDLEDITVSGESPEAEAQILQVEADSYDSTASNYILRLDAEQVIDGLSFRNLTIDGARPADDEPAGKGGEASLMGVILRRGSAGGGHNIVFENCLVRNCSASAFRFEESGVICRRVTADRAGRHGFNPVAADTKTDPGFVGENIKAINCDETGINHRNGTARIKNVYTSNNRSGNKWKHMVEQLVVRNHHSVGDKNSGWRSNHSNSSSDEVPETQNIVFDRVFVEEAEGPGIRISGEDTRIECKLRDIEVRQTAARGDSGAGMEITRDVTTLDEERGDIVVGETTNGAGVYVALDAVLAVDTYHHFDNDNGSVIEYEGDLDYQQHSNNDPGWNVYETPEQDMVGAFTTGDNLI